MMDIQLITHNLGGSYRNGKGYAPCPVCQLEGRKDQNALCLSQQGDKILAYCFKSHCSFMDIAKAAKLPRGKVGIDREAQKQADAKQLKYEALQLSKARSLWNASKPIKNTIAAKYLRGRGITGPLPDNLRFMPDIYHGASQTWCCAMVANIEPIGGVHRTYFDKKGIRLNKSAKMMLGPCSGGAVTLSKGSGPLVVTEGIETGLSLLQMLAERVPTVLATLSTSGMKAVKLPPKPHGLIIGVDGDEAGKLAANNLAIRATSLGWSVSLMEAPNGQDWNDILMLEADA